MEHISIEEVTEAYLDCRRNKRRTVSQIEYELDYEVYNLQLWRELNAMTYAIDRSIAFCVTYPKLREVFAASFRDRIVHHIIMRKFLDIFEARMIPASYNCRKGKGVVYGVRDVQRKIQRVTHNGAREAYALKLDVKAFFMSIDRQRMLGIITDIIREDYDGEDTEWWLWLISLVIMHRPERNCVWKGDTSLRGKLPAGKSLDTSDNRGMAIGNYTSQIFANIFMTVFDRWITSRLSSTEEYARFVDDFVIISPDKRHLLQLLTDCKRFLHDRLGLDIHDDKISLTKASQGVKFTGYMIRHNRIYVGKHTVRRMERMIQQWNNDPHPGTDRYIRRYNSYMGFLRVGNSYNIRCRMWRLIKHKENLENINNIKIRRIKDEKIQLSQH